jgi:hypothetical protein
LKGTGFTSCGKAAFLKGTAFRPYVPALGLGPAAAKAADSLRYWKYGLKPVPLTG